MDWADREAKSTIDLCRSLSGAPGDLEGIIAAKFRVAHAQGKADNICHVVDAVIGRQSLGLVKALEGEPVPSPSQDGYCRNS